MTFGSLFSGAGGFDMGFHDAGFDCLWTAEVDRNASDVLAKLGSPNLGDVTKIDGGSIPAPDVVVWGSPCQDISLANTKRRGLEGQHSGLFYEGIRIIKPLVRRGLRYSVWENVASALTSNGGNDFRQILLSFLELGARDIGWRVLDAKYFGVPQTRRRVFVIADFGGESCPSILRYTEAGEVCAQKGKEDGLEVSGASIHGTLTARSPARQARPGQILTHWGIKAMHPRCEMSPGYLINEGRRLRWRTPLESERLMGWPDYWTLTGASGKEMSDAARYKMTGNGVVLPVARFLAENIMQENNNER